MANKVPGEICFHENGRLFWVCMRHVPLDTEDSCFFSTDDVLVYDPYYGDFGPLNIAQLCRYCRMLEHKLADPQLSGKRIYHACKPQTDTRANSILLCCSYLVVCCGKTFYCGNTFLRLRSRSLWRLSCSGNPWPRSCSA